MGTKTVMEPRRAWKVQVQDVKTKQRTWNGTMRIKRHFNHSPMPPWIDRMWL